MPPKKKLAKYHHQSSSSLSSSGGGNGGTEETDSSETGEWWEREDHPLLNHVVLKTLFGFMGGQELKESRRVCKTWCKLSLASARSKFAILFDGVARKSTTGTRLSNFVEVFRENKVGIPIAEYGLHPFPSSKQWKELVREFLKICGSTAKRVSLFRAPPPVRRFEIGDISELLTNMPNIEYFSISKRINSRSGPVVKLFSDDSTKPKLTSLRQLEVYDWETQNTKDRCPTFMEEILSIAPNISDFKVQDSGNGSKTTSTIGQLLEAIEKLGHESVITNFILKEARNDHVEFLRRMAGKGMQLKSLGFYLRDRERNHSIECVPQVAKLFKNSIERLQVHAVCHNFVQLPYMPRLKTLEFLIPKNLDSRSVNLNKLCPVLKKLKLLYRDYENDEHEWMELLPDSEACPNVETLILGLMIVKIQLLDHVSDIFPKLTKLELFVKTDGVEILRKIMTEMTQLERLTVDGIVMGIKSIDAFYTGIPIQKIPELKRLIPKLMKMTPHRRAETICQRITDMTQHSQPCLSNLKNLKRLTLNTTGRSFEEEDGGMICSQMSDIFVYFGLYSMKHIKKLDLRNCEFSETSRRILRTEMGLEECNFDSCIN